MALSPAAALGLRPPSSSSELVHAMPCHAMLFGGLLSVSPTWLSMAFVTGEGKGCSLEAQGFHHGGPWATSPDTPTTRDETRYVYTSNVSTPSMEVRHKNKDTRTTQICLSCADKSTGREAETQQIGVRQPLYCVRHPDRDLGRLRRIPHLHLGAQAVVIAATFTLDSGPGIPFCPPAFKKSCTVALEPGWSRQGCPRWGSSTTLKPGPTLAPPGAVYSRMLAVCQPLSLTVPWQS